MKRYLKKISVAVVAVAIVSCSSKDDGGEMSQEAKVPADFALVFPANNAICQEGGLVADEPLQLTINIQWEASMHATEYELLVVESETNQEVTRVRTTATDVDVQLSKSTLYQWSVTAMNRDKSKTSSQRSFYTKGPGTGNHVPYPAYNIGFDADDTNDLLTITWEAADEDDDTLTFDTNVFGNEIEIDSRTDLQATSIDTIDITRGAQYYIVITVKDGISETRTTSNSFVYN